MGREWGRRNAGLPHWPQGLALRVQTAPGAAGPPPRPARRHLPGVAALVASGWALNAAAWTARGPGEEGLCDPRGAGSTLGLPCISRDPGLAGDGEASVALGANPAGALLGETRRQRTGAERRDGAAGLGTSELARHFVAIRGLWVPGGPRPCSDAPRPRLWSRTLPGEDRPPSG